MNLDCITQIETYQHHGWKLCAVRGKDAFQQGWNRPNHELNGEFPDHMTGVGLLHSTSGTMAFDIDDLDASRVYCAAHGVDLTELMAAPDAVRIESRPGRAKLLYRLDTPRRTRKRVIDGHTIFEFRCATAAGLPVQDVLPPSIHPDTQHPYRWAGPGDWRDLPLIPFELVALWDVLDSAGPKSPTQTISFHKALSSKDLTKIRGCLYFIRDNQGYDSWLQVGMALQALDDSLCSEWDAWSSSADNYQAGVCQDKWDSFTQGGTSSVDGGRGDITGDTLYWLARRGGWISGEDSSQILTDSSCGESPKGAPGPANLEALIAQLRPDSNIKDILLILRLIAGLSALEVEDTIEAICRLTGRGKRAVQGSLVEVRRKIRSEAIQARPELDGVPLVYVNFVNQDSESGMVLNTVDNLRALLKAYGIALGFNEMIHKVAAVEFPIGGKIIEEERDNIIQTTIESLCNLHGLKDNKVKGYMLMIASENAFHPVVQWLGDGHWDGISRIDKVFATLREADSVDEDHRRFGRRLLLKWMTSAIACLYGYGKRPPRGVLVLTGDQMVGKTSWFRYLFPEGTFYDGAHLDPADKDSVFRANNYWCVELGEIDSTFRTSDISALKAFIGSDGDESRRAYAANTSVIRRRTIFAGSCNVRQFNNDSTGSTRYWPIAIKNIDLDTLREMQEDGEELRQLWLEIRDNYYHRDYDWQLSDEDKQRLDERNRDFTTQTDVDAALDDRFDWASADRILTNRTHILGICSLQANIRNRKELVIALEARGIDCPIHPKIREGKSSRDVFMPPERVIWD